MANIVGIAFALLMTFVCWGQYQENKNNYYWKKLGCPMNLTSKELKALYKQQKRSRE